MKNIKRFMALIMSMIMVLSIMPFAVAKDVECEQTCPYIVVQGFASCDIYEDPSDPDSKTVFPPESDKIIDAVMKSIPSLGIYFSDKDGDKLASALVPIFLDLFGDAFLDNDGNVTNKSGVRFEWPKPEKIDKNSNLDFYYDWRLDPLVIADQLNDYINYVCECSGSDKVALMAHSCGGVITLAYVAKYGTEKIQGVVMNSTAIYGETYTGELLNGQVVLDMDSVRSYLRYALDKSEYDEVVDTLMFALSKAGLLDKIEQFGDELIADICDQAMNEVVCPMFTHWLTIWAMTPDEYLEDGFNHVFNEVCGDDGNDYTVLKGKIEAYNEIVRANRESLLFELDANGHFGVYARYGYSSFPITPSWDNISDGVIDTKYASFGATVSKYGETLPEEYIAGVDAEYISPDKTVDASTCLFAEKTWFVKGVEHGKGRILTELTKAILYADEDVTVYTYEAYPRYMIYDGEKFEPQTEDDTLSPIAKLIKLINQIVNILKLILSKLPQN